MKVALSPIKANYPTQKITSPTSAWDLVKQKTHALFTAVLKKPNHKDFDAVKVSLLSTTIVLRGTSFCLNYKAAIDTQTWREALKEGSSLFTKNYEKIRYNNELALNIIIVVCFVILPLGLYLCEGRCNKRTSTD